MADESERFIAGPEWRRPILSESSRWSEDVVQRSHLGSHFHSVPLQITTDAYRAMHPSSDGGEAGLGVSTDTSTTSRQRIASSDQKSVEKISLHTTSRGADKRRPHIFLNWWKELLACILFTGALLALFATVYAYDKQPSPNWPNWISLNTIISIYAILMEIGIVLITAEGIGQLKWSWFAKESRPLDDPVKYDDATRGPLGAIQLLWRLRARDLLSSFGALIVVLALGLSPFVQQVIRFYDCAIPLNEDARIPRTNYYQEAGGEHVSTMQINILPAVQRSVLAGVFSPSRSPSVTCSTGNCTWPGEHSTVSYCSACKDISDELVIVNQTYQFQQTNEYTAANGSLVNKTETITSWNLTTAVMYSDGAYGVTVNQTNPLYFEDLWMDYAAMGAWNPPIDYKPASGPFAHTLHSNASAFFDFIIATNVNGRSQGSAINPGTGEPLIGCNSRSSL